MPQIGTYIPYEPEKEQTSDSDAFQGLPIPAAKEGAVAIDDAEWEAVWNRLLEDEEFRKTYEAVEMYVPASVSYDMLNKIFGYLHEHGKPFGCKKNDLSYQPITLRFSTLPTA